MINDAVFEDLLATFGKSATTLDNKKLPEHKLGFLSTGCGTLDFSLGGGVPYGRLTEILGWQSSGKSVIAANLLASCQKKGGIAIMLDTENSLLSGWANTLGVDDKKLLILNTKYLEDAFDQIEIACEFAKKNKLPACLVVDSLSVLPGKKQLESEKTEDTKALGIEARIVSSALKKINKIIWDSQVALVLVSQIREKIGVMFGNPETTPHGNAIKFYSSVRIKTHAKGFIYPKTAKDDPSGMECRVTIMKNKMSRPRAPIEMDILFDSGIDKAKDAIMLGIKLEKIIFHKGGYYEYKGEKLRMAQFREKFKIELDDGSLLKEITSEADPDSIENEDTITEDTNTNETLTL
jgi:recombination protein RecA